MSPAADLTPPAHAARRGGATELAEALRASRRDTLATFDRCRAALPDLAVPLQSQVNPPLWELGHIGWFQEYWVARNPVRDEGAAADPEAPRGRALRANADALYDSGKVPHDARWTLPLPDPAATLADLDGQLSKTLALLEVAGSDDDALYFYRLALLHEDMHHEAALYMARSWGIAAEDARWRPAALAGPARAIVIEPGPWSLGSAPGSGFAFDNESAAHEIEMPRSVIDAQAVRWAEYLPFVECGAYSDDRWWTPAGRTWRLQGNATAPRYVRRVDGAWQTWRDGRWQPLDLAEAAVHLSWYEAEAWCRWAGRRLPIEAEWERAAVSRPIDFRWGDVWEWTASPFQAYPGFRPHPYRDYSAPWFDGRPVLRGASCLTQPRMRHPRYRNFFPAHRNDVPAGFRSCAV